MMETLTVMRSSIYMDNLILYNLKVIVHPKIICFDILPITKDLMLLTGTHSLIQKK